MMLLTRQPPFHEPKTLRTTIEDQRWVVAMKEELQVLHDYKTWKLVPQPENINVVRSKIKYKDDGTFDHFKAHHVVKGFTQVFRQNYIETYSLVVRPIAIRLVIALALSRNQVMKQLDIKKAFLHGELKEIVFKEQPLGFQDPQ